MTHYIYMLWCNASLHAEHEYGYRWRLSSDDDVSQILTVSIFKAKSVQLNGASKELWNVANTANMEPVLSPRSMNRTS
jgi:hypothetical protein